MKRQQQVRERTLPPARLLCRGHGEGRFRCCHQEGLDSERERPESSWQVVTFAVPTARFGNAFDRPTIDPQVLAEQQKKTQEDLRKRSEELRKRLISQSSEPTQAPAINAAATRPKR
jgi:hypothetical protein